MMQRIHYTLAVLFLGVVSFAGLAEPARKSQDTPKPSPDKANSAIPSDPGERAFAANCSRCHNAPEQLNPRITGTIVRHMRVRANLSAADERALMRFFNP